MATATIEIVREGTPQARAFRGDSPDSPVWEHGPWIWVSTFRPFTVGQQHGASALGTSVRVIGYSRGLTEVYREDVPGTSRYEPETRNQLGTLGASRDLAPSGEAVQAAIERARAALTPGAAR